MGVARKLSVLCPRMARRRGDGWRRGKMCSVPVAGRGGSVPGWHVRTVAGSRQEPNLGTGTKLGDRALQPNLGTEHFLRFGVIAIVVLRGYLLLRCASWTTGWPRKTRQDAKSYRENSRAFVLCPRLDCQKMRKKRNGDSSSTVGALSPLQGDGCSGPGWRAE